MTRTQLAIRSIGILLFLCCCLSQTYSGDLPTNEEQSNKSYAKYQPYNRVIFLIEDEGARNPRFIASARREVERRVEALRNEAHRGRAYTRSFGIGLIGKEQSWYSWRTAGIRTDVLRQVRLGLAAANPKMKKNGIRFLRDPTSRAGAKIGTEQLLNEVNGVNALVEKLHHWNATTEPYCQHIVVFTDGDFPSGAILKDADTPIDVVGPSSSKERWLEFAKLVGATTTKKIRHRSR